MTTVAPSLVGRDAELQLLERMLDESRAGTARFVVVTGEPGIGKTSLLGELSRRAETRRCLVLAGRASELEQELPFGLVVDAFDAYLQSLDTRSHERLAVDGLEELASVFPSLRSLRRDAGHPSTPAERFRAHHAVRELIERLAARQPLLLELDDLHWSDGASLELIGHLLRRPAQAAVMVVATFRTGQVDAALAGAIEAAARDGAVEQLALGPLSSAAAATLLDGRGSEERERLYRESGGNPFYLLQLARGRPQPSNGTRDTPHAAGVPDAVMAAIARELEGLAPPVRAFAEAAAVAGDPFELDLAIATAALPEDDALPALDELIARDLIRPGDVPRRFQFRHPLVRSAVYESCSPGSRLAAHERCGAALAERGAPAAVRAHHAEQSARHGDAGAVAVLREAGRAAAERAPSSASRWFEAALRLLPQSAPTGERAGLLLELAGSWAATGRLEGSRAALLETLELTDPAERTGRVALISTCAKVELLLGRQADAHQRLEDALEQLAEPESAEAASLMFGLAVESFFAMDFEALRKWAAATMRTARAAGERGLTAAGGGLLAFGCTLSPDTIGDAWGHQAQTAAIVDAMSDDELGGQLNAIAWLAPAEFYLDLYGPGIVHAERGLALASATGQGEFFPTLAQVHANLLYVTGRPREACELLEGVVASARLSDGGVGLAWSLLNLGHAANYAGDTEQALRSSAEAVAVARRFPDTPVAAWAGAVHARALLQAGDAAGAHRMLMELCGGEQVTRIAGGWQAIWLECSSACLLALGRLDDARRIAALAEQIAGRYSLPLATAVAHRAAAAVALADGDPATAAERALASAAGAGELGARIEASTARLLAGRALVQLGRAGHAADELERASAELEACGAPRLREPVERELRKLGRGAHRRTQRGKPDAKGVASLTGRELELAELVVDRRTNQEIAAELFLASRRSSRTCATSSASSTRARASTSRGSSSASGRSDAQPPRRRRAIASWAEARIRASVARRSARPPGSSRPIVSSRPRITSSTTSPRPSGCSVQAANARSASAIRARSGSVRPAIAERTSSSPAAERCSSSACASRRIRSDSGVLGAWPAAPSSSWNAWRRIAGSGSSGGPAGAGCGAAPRPARKSSSSRRSSRRNSARGTRRVSPISVTSSASGSSSAASRAYSSTLTRPVRSSRSIAAAIEYGPSPGSSQPPRIAVTMAGQLARTSGSATGCASARASRRARSGGRSGVIVSLRNRSRRAWRRPVRACGNPARPGSCPRRGRSPGTPSGSRCRRSGRAGSGPRRGSGGPRASSRSRGSCRSGSARAAACAASRARRRSPAPPRAGRRPRSGGGPCSAGTATCRTSAGPARPPDPGTGAAGRRPASAPSGSASPRRSRRR
jgi:tetratricopeptide (TPR) repeat protein